MHTSKISFQIIMYTTNRPVLNHAAIWNDIPYPLPHSQISEVVVSIWYSRIIYK